MKLKLKVMGLILLFFPLALIAEELTYINNNANDYPKWWLNLGVGKGTTFSDDVADISPGHAAQISFNGTFTPNVFMTVYSNGTSDNSYYENSARDIGIMGGYIQRDPKWYWSASLGLCYYKQEKGSRFLYQERSGAGIPLQVQAFWTPFKHFGIGLIGHVVASQDPYATGLFAIQVF